MLSEIFYWLLDMSISASIAGCVILLLGKIRNIPRRILHVLWVIPLFRMWIPIGLSSKYSLMTQISKYTTRSVTVYRGFPELSMTNFVMAAEDYFPITYKVDALGTVYRIAGIVWIIIMAALLLIFSMVYAVTKWDIKDARHFRDHVYISGKAESPAVYGIIRPKIVIPELYDLKDYKYILMHENAHIRRKDNLWRIIAVITVSVHWFNPLSWLFLRCFLQNLEHACDETVLAQCGEEERKGYAASLLNCAESRNLYAAAFGGAKIRTRIDRILSYKKLSAFSAAFFVVLSIYIGYVLLTNAVS